MVINILNFFYLLNPYSCGYFCLKKIFKNKIRLKFEKEFMSFFEIYCVLVLNKRFCFFTTKKIYNISNYIYICLVKKNNGFHYIVILKDNHKYFYYYDPSYLFLIKIKKEKLEKRIIKYKLQILVN